MDVRTSASMMERNRRGVCRHCLFVEADVKNQELSIGMDTVHRNLAAASARPKTRPRQLQLRPLRMLNQVNARVAAAREAIGDEVRRWVDRDVLGSSPSPARPPFRGLDEPHGHERLGPALCLAACGLLGVDKRRAIGSATALEVYRCSLGPSSPGSSSGSSSDLSAASRFAVMLGALHDNARTLPPPAASRMLAIHSELAREVAEGQATFEGWTRDDCWDIEQLDYVKAVCRVRAWGTFVAPVLCGAAVANPASTRTRWLRRHAVLLGVAFYVAAEAEAAAVTPGLRSLPLLHAVHAAEPGLRDELVEALQPLDRVAPTNREGVPERLPAVQAQRVRDAMAVAGSVKYARFFAHQLAGQARDALDQACQGLPISGERAFFEELTQRCLDRTAPLPAEPDATDRR